MRSWRKSVLAWLVLLGVAAEAHALPHATLRVQLSWHHQSQFAGFYVADKARYFGDEGLDVAIVPGGPGRNAADALQSGEVDVAVVTYAEAMRLADGARPIVNVAQVFQGSSLRLICRGDTGVAGLRDVAGRTVAIGTPEDRLVVDWMLRSVVANPAPIRYVERGDSVAPLLERRADCITGEVYNEYRHVEDSRESADDFVVFNPTDFGAPALDDGLYVLQSRLDDEQFIDRLAHLVRALRRGWEDARSHPSSAVDIILSRNPALERAEQASMLEAVFDLLPARDLMYLDPSQLERITRGGRPVETEAWTHQVWNRTLELDGKPEVFHRSTLHLAAQAAGSAAFTWVLMFGFCIYALAATIDAVSHGYDLWGRLVLALVAVMGGGILRDLILARSRLPFAFLEDPTVPLAILFVVLGYSLVLIGHPDIGRTQLLQTVRRYSEAVGFGIVTVYGALACILAGSKWFWAPFAAAMTIAGGGIMRDVIINREPRNFRGAIFEEVGVLAGLMVVGGLMVANHFEHSAWPVYAVLVLAAATAAALQLVIQHYHVRYPRWLAQPAIP